MAYFLGRDVDVFITLETQETNKAIGLYKDWMGNLEPILNGQFPFQHSKLKDVYANKLVIKWESNNVFN